MSSSLKYIKTKPKTKPKRPHRTFYNITAIIKDKRGRILSIGKNSYLKTHPIMLELSKLVGYHKNEKINLHAEIDAILKCNNLDKAHTMEIFNFSDRSDSYRASKPCEICMSAINKTKIRKLFYTTSDYEQVEEEL